MEPKDLVKVWDAPDHSKLTPKQISIRLPISAAARIEAFCEMFPSKTKTQIITDLITTALDQAVEGLSSKKGKFIAADLHRMDPEYQEMISRYGDKPADFNEVSGVYEDIGQKGRFLRITKKHLRKLEKEAKINEPIYCPDPVIIDHDN